jgi:hypothetical protein
MTEPAQDACGGLFRSEAPMSTHALRQAAARSSSSPRFDANGQRPLITYATLLPSSERLDALLQDVSLGRSSAAAVERHLDEIRAIAAGLLAIAGGQPVPDAVHPPLKQDGGRAWW